MTSNYGQNYDHLGQGEKDDKEKSKRNHKDQQIKRHT